MRIEWKKYDILEKEIEALVTIFERLDRWKLRRLYFRWKNLNDDIKKISTRGINLPEVISENAFCLFFPECVRVVRLRQGKCSYDLLNRRTGERIQIKASSIDEDLTSFGPRSEWDTLYFLDFSKGIRKLTPKECFLLQGFPQSFKLPSDVSDSDLYHQAGNSVSVPVIERIAKNISLAFEGKCSDFQTNLT
jgi:hypothetical protein